MSAKFIKKIFASMERHQTDLLAGTAIVSLFSAVVCAYRCRIDAEEIVKRRKEQYKLADTKEEQRSAIRGGVKELMPVVLPTAISIGVSVASILGANSKNKRKIALLTSACSLSEKAITELNTKMRDVLGDKKAQDIQTAIAKDHLNEAIKRGDNQKILCGNMKSDSDVRCFDEFSGRPFWSNATKIGMALNEWSSDIRNNISGSLNDFYYLINLDGIPAGEDFGYLDQDLIRGSAPVTMSAILGDDQCPYLCIHYENIHLINSDDNYYS